MISQEYKMNSLKWFKKKVQKISDIAYLEVIGLLICDLTVTGSMQTKAFC